jgi:hypothetical protein
LTEDAFKYMSDLIEEDSPGNAKELFSLIQDFLTDGMVYSEDAGFKVCEVLSKLFLEKSLVTIE